MALETFYWLAWKLPVAGSLGFQNGKERNSAIHRVTKAGLCLVCNFVRKWVITHNVTEVWDGRLAWLQERSGVFFFLIKRDSWAVITFAWCETFCSCIYCISSLIYILEVSFPCKIHLKAVFVLFVKEYLWQILRYIYVLRYIYLSISVKGVVIHFKFWSLTNWRWEQVRPNWAPSMPIANTC